MERWLSGYLRRGLPRERVMENLPLEPKHLTEGLTKWSAGRASKGGIAGSSRTGHWRQCAETMPRCGGVRRARRGKGWSYGEQLRKSEMCQTAALSAGREDLHLRFGRSDRTENRKALAEAGALLALRRLLPKPDAGEGARGRAAGFAAASRTAAYRRGDGDGRGFLTARENNLSSKKI